LFKIQQCYDSHLHLMATGQVAEGLSLSQLKSAYDVSKLKLNSNFFRGDWLVGFGWDEYNWQDGSRPHKSILDLQFKDFPVSLTRADGHACWVNSVALKKIGKPDHETGIFLDNEKVEIDLQIPDYSVEQKKNFSKKAVGIINRQGVTHVRDMSGSWQQWEILRDLDLNNQLTLYVEQNFTCENLQDLDRALSEAHKALLHPSPHLKVAGIKLYFDGALGSDGAWLSQSEKNLALWPLEDLEKAFIKIWQNNFPVAIHAIGDEAADQIAKLLIKLKADGFHGPIGLEHAQVMRTETIEKLKQLDIRCFMQPCHWLSDQRWLQDKLKDLYRFAFPWFELEKAGIPFFWGSDSPIEPVSIHNNLKALKLADLKGIRNVQASPLKYYSYPDLQWGGHCYSDFSDESVKSVIFDGKPIL
jgi:predicted amidohydrolase YtcJ